MIRVRTAAAAALAAGAAVAATPAVASADGAPPPSEAYAGGVVVASDGGYEAVVRVAYTCTTDVTDGNHLFVALKQGSDVTPENFSSSSTQLTSFLSTNWSSDAGPNALTCDGRRHVQKVVLRQQPGFDGAPVTTGPAAVQICVFDNITGFEGHEPLGGYAGDVTMQRVVVSHAPGR